MLRLAYADTVHGPPYGPYDMGHTFCACSWDVLRAQLKSKLRNHIVISTKHSLYNLVYHG